MNEDLGGLLIVVPTRNRASLAVNAIRSVLEQECPRVEVLVSDNSNQPEESRKLEDHCRGLADGRLSYVRPPEPLPMSQHWNWAIEQALRRSSASHFVYLTDRMIFRPGELQRLVEILDAFPERVVSYNHDRLLDHVRPIRVQQLPWSGQIIEIESRELLSLVSRSVLYHPALPKMLNCAVPRTVLSAVRERFGTIFDSISPDFNFCFRCLDTAEGVLYYDRSALIHYALDRSNGMGFERGLLTPDHKDFLNSLGASAALQFFTPIPEVQTVGNAIFHEYCTVRQETGSPRFPAVEIEPYLEYLAGEVHQLENRELRGRMRLLLERHGWRESVRASSPGPSATRSMGSGRSPKTAYKLLLRGTVAAISAPRWVVHELLWLAVRCVPGNLWLLLARWFGVPLRAHSGLGFWSREAALEYAIRYPPRKSVQPDHLPGRFRALREHAPAH